MRPTLGGRVDAARRRAFVGRRAEQDLFREALAADDDPPFSVLHVHGPGGIGKSALLRVFGELAEGAGAVVVRVDGRDLAPGGDALRSALAPARDGAGRVVLLVDTYEQLAPLDGLLREELLPQLPPDVLVVLAGRRPPATAWTDDPGWHALLRVLPLAPLSATESAAYLAAITVADDDRQRVLDFCSGYPLALVLAGQLALGGTDDLPERLVAPDVVGRLVSRLVDAAPTPTHHAALQVCALARATDEGLLRAVLGDDGPALFDWLRSRAGVEAGPRGLYPHDLVRDLLVSDLRWRDAEAARELEGRVRRAVLARLGTRTDDTVLDFVFHLRHHPVTRTFYDWDTFGSVPAHPYRAADRDGVLALLGDTAVARWLDVQPAAFTVCHDEHGVRGFLCWLSLRGAPDDAVAADPVTAAAWAWALERGLQPDQELTVMRQYTDRVTEQRASPMLDAASVRHVRQVLTRPEVAFDVLVTTDPGYLGPLWTHLGYRPEWEVVVGGRRCTAFARDWRSVPRRGIWRGVAPPRPRAEAPDPAFVDAVRAALRDLAAPERLARNPLLTRGVAGGADELHDRVVDAVERLRGRPRDEKSYRALHRTYLRPAATQELAAEVLGLPFSTYRRHLAHGVSQVADALWTAHRD